MGRTKRFPPAGVEGGAVGCSIQRSWREEGMSAQLVATQQQELGWSSASEREKSQPCGRESAGARVCGCVVAVSKGTNLTEMLCSCTTGRVHDIVRS